MGRAVALGLGAEGANVVVAEADQAAANEVVDEGAGFGGGGIVVLVVLVDEEFETVWSGQKTAKQALDDAVRRSNEQVEKFEKANK